MKYDVIIIGAGPSGIFCAYELLKEKPDLKVLMIEKGRSIESRQCPKRKTKKCVNCKPCSITTGFAGAGAFSDGKLSLSPDVGGNLPEILGYEKTVELIHESDQIYLDFGADKNVYGVDKEKEIREIRRRAINANLKLIECPIRHLGSNILKRYEGRTNLIEGPDFLLDQQTYTLYIHNTSVVLPKNQGKLLVALLSGGDALVTTEQLCMALWGTTEYIDENALQVNLTRLKKTMSALEMKQRIVAVRGMGYRLEAEVSL